MARFKFATIWIPRDKDGWIFFGDSSPWLHVSRHATRIKIGSIEEGVHWAKKYLKPKQGSLNLLVEEIQWFKYYPVKSYGSLKFRPPTPNGPFVKKHRREVI